MLPMHGMKLLLRDEAADGSSLFFIVSEQVCIDWCDPEYSWGNVSKYYNEIYLYLIGRG